MSYKQAIPTKSGLYRIHGMFGKYGKQEPARIWIGTSQDNPLQEMSIIKLRDARGNTDEVFAGTEGLQFS